MSDLGKRSAKKKGVQNCTGLIFYHKFLGEEIISIANALLTPHHSARCTNVQSNIELKQERRLALCYLKFHANAIIRQTIMNLHPNLPKFIYKGRLIKTKELLLELESFTYLLFYCSSNKICSRVGIWKSVRSVC